ncbi:hypothetical protein, partial [Acinetobacter baumannii]|uniref:hypothetical protein n=1 Tax=Acinetobacter baumannii TaxID=470 RepID=UPI00339AC3A9
LWRPVAALPRRDEKLRRLPLQLAEQRQTRPQRRHGGRAVQQRLVPFERSGRLVQPDVRRGYPHDRQ